MIGEHGARVGGDIAGNTCGRAPADRLPFVPTQPGALEGRVDLVRGGRPGHEALHAVVDQFPRPSGCGHDRHPAALHGLNLRQR